MISHKETSIKETSQGDGWITMEPTSAGGIDCFPEGNGDVMIVRRVSPVDAGRALRGSNGSQRKKKKRGGTNYNARVHIHSHKKGF